MTAIKVSPRGRSPLEHLEHKVDCFIAVVRPLQARMARMSCGWRRGEREEAEDEKKREGKGRKGARRGSHCISNFCFKYNSFRLTY